VLSHEELVIKVARRGPTPEAAAFLGPDLRRVIREEANLRYRLWAQGIDYDIDVLFAMWRGGRAESRAVSCAA
jgi:hypothetical protein